MLQTYMDKLKATYSAKEDEIKSKNEKLSEEYLPICYLGHRLCHSKLNEMALPLEKKAAANAYTTDAEGLKQMDRDVNEMLANYDKQAKGPAKVRVLTQRMPQYMKKLMESAARSTNSKMAQLDTDYKARIAELDEKVGIDKQELERLRDKEKTAHVKVRV